MRIKAKVRKRMDLILPGRMIAMVWSYSGLSSFLRVVIALRVLRPGTIQRL